MMTMDLQSEAVQRGKRVDLILKALNGDEPVKSPAFEVEIEQIIQFFGNNITKIENCNYTIIKLAGIFVKTFEHWSVNSVNILFMLLTTDLVERRKQRVVRLITKAMIEFAKCVSEAQLKSLVKLNSEPIMLIFRKLGTASTLYTQSKILEVLYILTSALDDKGAETIKQEQIIGINRSDIAEEAFTLFKDIQRDNFLDSSRPFLKLYNEKIVKEPHVFSIEVYLIDINDILNDEVLSRIIVDFNLRDLSISFFINGNQWRNSEDSQETQHFFELVDCDVEARLLETSDNVAKDSVEVIVKPQRCHVDEKVLPDDGFPRIQSIRLVISNENISFQSKILPLLEKKVIRHNNDNMIELTMINNLKAATTLFTGCSLGPNQLAEATSTIQQPKRTEKRLFTRELESQAVMSPLKKVKKTTTVPRQDASDSFTDSTDFSGGLQPFSSGSPDFILSAKQLEDDDKKIVIIEKFNMKLTRFDLSRLDGSNWLNDQNINFFMQLIQMRSTKFDGLPTVHVMDTCFMLKLEKSGYTGVKRHMKNIKMFDFDIIIVPVHIIKHWCLAVIHIVNKTIRYYDSMGHPNQKLLEQLTNYLIDESMDKRQITLDMSDWSVECVLDCPQQKNNCDCGVFCCMFAEFVSRDVAITFTQGHMKGFRQKMKDCINDGVMAENTFSSN